jgi:lipid-binding SYLF domain-containing protein
MRNRLLQLALAAALAGGTTAGLTTTGCSTAPKTSQERQALDDEARASLTRCEGEDPTLRDMLDRAYGYAVFPSIGKGGLGIGGAYGRGEVFERGRLIGYCDMTQATIGLQAGGQKYTEIISFQDKAALDTFKSGKFAFDAQATAVAVKSGAGANAPYRNGVAVLTCGEAGLMAEASVGGQKFSFQPL